MDKISDETNRIFSTAKGMFTSELVTKWSQLDVPDFETFIPLSFNRSA